MKNKTPLSIVRRWLVFFILCLFLSGLTAIPLETEIRFLCRTFPPDTALGAWLDRVLVGITAINRDFPFLNYGNDWLAFAHFVLAILFIGPLRDPIRNKWVIEFGMIACLLVIPYALVAGHFRGIPVWWRLIDCSFGLIGLIPLAVCYRRIDLLESDTRFSTRLSYHL